MKKYQLPKGQYTKGPWQLDELPHWIKGKDGVGDICRISNHSGYEDLRGSDLANAKLIAAAPELLEALQLLLSAYQSDGSDDFYNKDVEQTAKNAINKALL